MRLLLISDTHGRLGIINELAGHVRADVVIYAGDFGFFDDGGSERLLDRALRLHGRDNRDILYIRSLQVLTLM